MKTVLIISYSPLDRDPRVRRQIEALKDDYKVIAAGNTPPNMEGVEFINIGSWRSKNRYTRKLSSIIQKRHELKYVAKKDYEKAYWSPTMKSVQKTLRNVKCDAIIANDVDMLPIACLLATKLGVQLYSDIHEYATEQFPDEAYKNGTALVYRWALEKFFMQPAFTTTVSDSFAERYEEEFGRKPDVVFNAPHQEDLKPSTVTEGKINLVHHGVALPQRNLELMIDIMPLLDEKFHLNVMLVLGSKRYLDTLKERANGMKNVSFLEPVGTEKIAAKVNEFDIGLYMLNAKSYNMEHALPNKIFEFIQGRLGIAVWPSYEMAGLVKKHDMGWVTEERSLQEMADLLNNLTVEEIQAKKEAAHKASVELSFTRSRELIRHYVAEMTK